MVSNLSLCLTLGLLTCNPNSMSEDIITQQKHYSQLESTDVEQMVSELYSMQTSYKTFTLEEMDKALNTYNYLLGYQDYLEEQKRLEEERIAEEQRRLEEEQARIEQERQHQEWLNSFDRQGFRQTTYTVAEGETSLGSGLYYGHPNVKVIDNVMHYNDSEYGWLPIYAININEVLGSGLNQKGTPNLYGSIIELKHNNKTWLGFVADACGACSRSSKVDLWAYHLDYSLDVQNIDWRIIRYGY